MIFWYLAVSSGNLDGQKILKCGKTIFRKSQALENMEPLSLTASCFYQFKVINTSITPIHIIKKRVKTHNNIGGRNNVEGKTSKQCRYFQEACINMMQSSKILEKLMEIFIDKIILFIQKVWAPNKTYIN